MDEWIFQTFQSCRLFALLSTITFDSNYCLAESPLIWWIANHKSQSGLKNHLEFHKARWECYSVLESIHPSISDTAYPLKSGGWVTSLSHSHSHLQEANSTRSKNPHRHRENMQTHHRTQNRLAVRQLWLTTAPQWMKYFIWRWSVTYT